MSEYLKEIPIPKGAKTGQEITDYLIAHPDYQCAKNCLWIKLENLVASQEYAKILRKALRELRWDSKISEDGSGMKIPAKKMMGHFAELEEIVDDLSAALSVLTQNTSKSVINSET